MDPITHSLVGAAMARVGAVRAVPGATAILVLAANAPDVDALTYLLASSDLSLELRRGFSHGPIALVSMAALLYVVWRWWQRRWSVRLGSAGSNPSADASSADDPSAGRPPGAGSGSPRTLLLFCFLAVLSHPLLDWLNTYGIRFLIPFSGRWFYGDVLFIVDPWLWFLLGAGLYAGSRRLRQHRRRWGVLAVATTTLVALAPVSLPTKILFFLLCGGLFLGTVQMQSQRRQRLLFSAAALYLVAALVGARAARMLVASELQARGIVAERFMVGPQPLTPFVRDVVVETGHELLAGELRWWGAPRLELTARWPRPPGTGQGRSAFDLGDGSEAQVVADAWQHHCIRGFRTWARFPVALAERHDDGWRVHFHDLRYAREPGAGFANAVVELLASP